MTFGVTAALADAFRSLHVRTVRAPWDLPGGAYLELDIRPHDDPEYRSAIKDLGVTPRAAAERKEPRSLIERRAIRGLLKGQDVKAADLGDDDSDDALIADDIERQRYDIARIGFPWNHYPVAYDLREVESVRESVGKHLVAAARLVSGESVTEASAEDVAQWFQSDKPLPHALPALSSGEDDDGPPEAVDVYLGGVAEGTAVAAFVLKEAVQEHLFMESLAPLGNSSVSTPGAPDTTTAKPSSPTGSGPRSAPDIGAAKIAAVEEAA